MNWVKTIISGIPVEKSRSFPDPFLIMSYYGSVATPDLSTPNASGDNFASVHGHLNGPRQLDPEHAAPLQHDVQAVVTGDDAEHLPGDGRHNTTDPAVPYVKASSDGCEATVEVGLLDEPPLRLSKGADVQSLLQWRYADRDKFRDVFWNMDIEVIYAVGFVQ